MEWGRRSSSGKIGALRGRNGGSCFPFDGISQCDRVTVGRQRYHRVLSREEEMKGVPDRSMEGMLWGTGTGGKSCRSGMGGTRGMTVVAAPLPGCFNAIASQHGSRDITMFCRGNRKYRSTSSS